MTYPDLKLMQALEKAAHAVAREAEWASAYIDGAISAFEDLPDMRWYYRHDPDHDAAQMFMDDVASAAESHQDAVKQLGRVDKELRKLLEARRKLGEAFDLPFTE